MTLLLRIDVYAHGYISLEDTRRLLLRRRSAVHAHSELAARGGGKVVGALDRFVVRRGEPGG